MKYSDNKNKCIFSREKLLLMSQVPEVIMLAILSKYPKDEGEQVLKETVKKLIQASKSKNDLGKYMRQLTILANLRKLEPFTVKILQNMSLNIDINDSYLYNLGLTKGREEEQVKYKQKQDLLILQAIAMNILRLEQIAKLFDVSLEYVQELKKQYNNE